MVLGDARDFDVLPRTGPSGWNGYSCGVWGFGYGDFGIWGLRFGIKGLGVWGFIGSLNIDCKDCIVTVWRFRTGFIIVPYKVSLNGLLS